MDIFVLVVPWLSPIKVAVELKSPALVTGTMRRAGGFFSCPDYGAIFKPPIPLLVSRELWAMHVCSQSATIVDERVQWWACAGKNSPRRSHSVSYYSLSVFCFFFICTRDLRRTRQKAETRCLMLARWKTQVEPIRRVGLDIRNCTFYAWRPSESSGWRLID